MFQLLGFQLTSVSQKLDVKRFTDRFLNFFHFRRPLSDRALSFKLEELLVFLDLLLLFEKAVASALVFRYMEDYLVTQKWSHSLLLCLHAVQG